MELATKTALFNKGQAEPFNLFTSYFHLAPNTLLFVIDLHVSFAGIHCCNVKTAMSHIVSPPVFLLFARSCCRNAESQKR